MLFADELVVVRGGGDLAPGVAFMLIRAGLRVAVTDLARLLGIGRSVAFA